MAITAPSVGTVLKDDTNTTHSIAAPADVSDGRILLKIACLENVAESLTDADGDWTQIVNFNETVLGSNRSIAVWWKLASSESGSYSFSHSTSAQGWGVVLSYPGVNTSTPMDATAQTAEYENDDTPLGPAITTVTDNAWVLTILWKGGGTSVAVVDPSGFTERVNDFTGTWALGVSDIDAGVAASETVGDWSSVGSGGDSSLVTIALRPASDSAIAAVMHHRKMLGMS
jgi:hypothetical protein